MTKIVNKTCMFVVLITFLLIAGCAQPSNPTSTFTPNPYLQPQNPTTEADNSGNVHTNSSSGQGEHTNSPPREKEDNKDTFIIQAECSVQPGRDASFIVTFQDKPVVDARVFVNHLEIGNTDDSGRTSFLVPYTQELKLEVSKDDLNVELYIDLTEEFGG